MKWEVIALTVLVISIIVVLVALRNNNNTFWTLTYAAINDPWEWSTALYLSILGGLVKGTRVVYGITEH